MPVFNFDFNRSVTNLDLSARRSGVFTPGIERLELREEALARFNALVRLVAPGHPAFDAAQIAGAARRVRGSNYGAATATAPGFRIC